MDHDATVRLQHEVEEFKDAYAQERHSAKHLAHAAMETSKGAVLFADDWVRYNAWKLIGISIGIGLATGLLLRLRSDRPDTARVPR